MFFPCRPLKSLKHLKKKKCRLQSARKWSHYVEEHLSLVSSITVTERAVQIIRFYLLHARLLQKLAQDFLCSAPAGCLETRQGKEHCGSYLPIKGTTRTSVHFAFVSDRACFNGTNCMILRSCAVGNLAPPRSTLQLWANYFHWQGNISSLCLENWRKKKTLGKLFSTISLRAFGIELGKFQPWLQISFCHLMTWTQKHTRRLLTFQLMFYLTRQWSVKCVHYRFSLKALKMIVADKIIENKIIDKHFHIWLNLQWFI